MKIKEILYNIFVLDWKNKVLALMLAATTWLYTYLIGSSKIPQLVPIEIKGESPVFMTEISPKEIEITLTGSQRILNRFYLKPIVGTYPISKLSLPIDEDIKIIDIPTREFFDLPPDVYFAEPPSPSKVYITLIKSQTKLLEVRPSIVLKSVEEYEIVSISCTPGLILVKGPRHILADKNYVETLPIYLPKLEKQGLLTVQATLQPTINSYRVEYKTVEKILVNLDIKKK